MKIFIIRHGQTDMNVQKLLAGHQDAKLTKEGISQAKLLGERLKGLEIDRIFSSDLLRARDTTSYLSKHLSAPIEFQEILRERTWGELDLAPTSEYRRQLEISKLPYHKFKTQGGESVEEVVSRARAFLDSLFDQYASGTFLISGHHVINKALLLNLLKLSWENWSTLDQNNTCLNELSRSKDGTWFADKINCTLHLDASGFETI
jgi:broad specificity phosphatase PhoE